MIRAAIQEHRAVLGLVNLAEKISALKKDKERYYRLVLHYFVFLDRELERKAEMKLSEEINEEWERRKAFSNGEALHRRSNVQHQVTFRDYRLKNPSRHHEGDLSGVRC